MDLAWVGLSQFLPALLLVQVTDSAADRLPRRKLMDACLTVMGGASLRFLTLAHLDALSLHLMFVLMRLFGTAHAFCDPVRPSLAPNS
jgi:hypothetical protein